MGKVQLFRRIGDDEVFMDFGKGFGQLIQQGIVTIYLFHVKRLSAYTISRGQESSSTDPLQELHVLPRQSRLTEFKQLMRCCWIMQDDLEDLGAEEIGNAIDRHVFTGR